MYLRLQTTKPHTAATQATITTIAIAAFPPEESPPVLSFLPPEGAALVEPEVGDVSCVVVVVVVVVVVGEAVDVDAAFVVEVSPFDGTVDAVDAFVVEVSPSDGTVDAVGASDGDPVDGLCVVPLDVVVVDGCDVVDAVVEVDTDGVDVVDGAAVEGTPEG